MRHRYCAEYNGTAIRPIHEEDIEKLRKWRNDQEISKYLFPRPSITPAMQKKWFEQYIVDENVIFFAIVDLKRNRTIGTVALYDFNVDLCEVGKILIGDLSERGRGIGYNSMLMAMGIGIMELGIERFLLKVYENNMIARNLYKKIGFIEKNHSFIYGENVEIDMTISKEEFLSQNNQVDEIYFYKEKGK